MENVHLRVNAEEHILYWRVYSGEGYAGECIMYNGECILESL